MTDPTTDIAIPEDDMIGLEDFDIKTDAVMPTIKIAHKEALFEDALSGKTFPALNCVLLGLIKQRVLWPPEVEETKSAPLCKSYNYTIGRPDVDKYPWKASGFEKIDNDPEVELPCENCKLKDWGSHPKRDTPWCSEQHTFALLQQMDDDEGSLSPALFTVQRSAIKPSKTYMTSFVRAKTALFTVRTKIILDARKRGTVEFAVPKFIRGEATAQEDWNYYGQQYRMIREFVQTPRSRDDDAEIEAEDSGAPIDSAATSAPEDDDLPF